MNARLLIIIFALVVFMMLLSGINQNAKAAGVEIGSIVDNFTLPDFDGSDHTLYDYKGHVIFINFWAVQ